MGLLVFVALVLCGLALFVAFVYVVCWFPWRLGFCRFDLLWILLFVG